ncbi:MAG: voltage-gated potassium channel [Cyclobacteriaceae bacterium]
MLNYLETKKIKTVLFKILIGAIVYFILISLLIHFERDSPQSAITDYSHAIWFSIVTLTTVGYGDLYPATIFGQYIGYVFVFLSLGVYGILVGQFASIISTIKENKMLGYNGTTLMNHVVIIGWNEFSQMVTDQLIGAGKDVAIVTDKREHVDHIREKYHKNGVFTLYTDFQNYEILLKANITESSVVFVNLPDDTEKLVYILNLKKAYDGLEFVVTIENSNLKNTFIGAGVTNAISPNEISSKILASYMFEPDVASYTEDIMSFAKNENDYDIKQFLVTHDNPYLNKTYQESFFDLKKRYNTVLIGISKKDKNGNRKLIKNPLGEIGINLGDYLIVILNGTSFELILKVFNVEEGYFKETKKK